MTKYEREHGGQTPAEDGERAVRFEEQPGSYKIWKAALALVKAQATLQDYGVEVTDWEAIGGKVNRIEIRNIETGDKTWIPAN